jgi:hypothetical protein
MEKNRRHKITASGSGRAIRMAGVLYRRTVYAG